MAQNETNTTDESETEHRAADLDTIVVDPDDVVEVMRRNWHDQIERRSHSLRVTPPFEGERTATPHVSQDGTMYDPAVSQLPIHLSPAAFLVGDSRGWGHPDAENSWRYPNRHSDKHNFRREFDAYDENGDTRPLTDEEEELWEQWWAEAVEVWEQYVRGQLKDGLRVVEQATGESVTVDVRYESDD